MVERSIYALPTKDVREAVLRDWASVKRKQTNEAFYEALRSRYTVTVEGAGKASMATASQ